MSAIKFVILANAGIQYTAFQMDLNIAVIWSYALSLLEGIIIFDAVG